MNLFQFFSLLVIICVLLYLMVRFLRRKQGKVCNDCQKVEVPRWTNTSLGSQSVAREQNEESDLSDDEAEEEAK